MQRIIRIVGCITVAALLLINGRVMAVTDYPHLPPPEPDVYLDRSGFNELLLNQAGFGAQMGFALTSSVFRDELRQVSGGFLGFGAGIALPFLLLRDKPVPSGNVVYLNQLQRLGLLNGAFLYNFINPRGPISDNEYRIFQGILAGGGLLGLGASILTMDIVNPSPGQGSALGAGYYYGLFTGAIITLMLDIDDERSTFGAMLGFANAGLAAAFLMLDHLDINRSAVWWTTLGAGVGTGIGIGTGFLFGGESAPEALIAGAALAGFWAGAIITYKYILPKDGYKKRADIEYAGLINLDDRGRFNLGMPSVSPILFPSDSPGKTHNIGATVRLIDWRAQ